MKFLACIDGSESSDFTVDILVKLYKPGDEVVILSVGRFQEFSIPHKYRATPDENAEILADRYVAKLNDLCLDNITREVDEGDPRHIICQKAKELNADMLLLGARGLGSLQKLLLGSVSEYVASHSPCTTIIVHSQSL